MQIKMEKNAVISFWSKVLITLCTVSLYLLLGHALYNHPKSYLGLPFVYFLLILIVLILATMALVVIMWGFPRSKPIFMLGWLLRFGRELILITTICGIIRLVAAKFSPFSLRGGIVYFNVIALLIIALLEKPLQDDRKVFPIHIDKFRFEMVISPKIYSVLRWILGIGIAIVPALATLAIIRWGYHSTLSSFRPFIWNDQTVYWTWVRSFSAHGFNMGYSVMNEIPAGATFNHNGSNSPIYVYLYGTVARLAGWSPQLPIIINFVLLALGILVFIRSAKLDLSQITLTALVILLMWPILIFLPTTFHETLNQTIGILSAGIFYLLLTKGMTLNYYRKILFLIFVYIASLVRISWGLLFFPLIFISLEMKLAWKIIITAGLGTILLFSSLELTSYLLPSLNYSVFNIIRSGSQSGLKTVFEYFLNQWKYLMRSEDLASPANRVIVFEVFVFLVWSLVQWVKLIRKNKTPLESVFNNQPAFDTYILLSLLLAGFLFYIADGFYRVFSAVLLISILMQIAWKNYKPIYTFLVFNLIFAMAFLPFYKYGQVNYERDDPAIVQSRQTLAEYIVFDNGTKNPWCNTVLIPLSFYDYRVALFPAGIGISDLYFKYPISYPLRSKYFLFDTATYTNLRDKLNAEFLTSTSEGDLYYNRDSGCSLK